MLTVVYFPVGSELSEGRRGKKFTTNAGLLPGTTHNSCYFTGSILHNKFVHREVVKALLTVDRNKL